MKLDASRKILLFGGMVLAAVGMFYGVYYAVFVEHQTLDGMGGALFASFQHTAERDAAATESSLNAYAATKYIYVRQVDLHSHWAGLAMILMVLGICFDRVGFAAGFKKLLALALLLGAVTFPLGVYLQSIGMADVGKIMAIAGSALVVAGMAAAALGFARGPQASS